MTLLALSILGFFAPSATASEPADAVLCDTAAPPEPADPAAPEPVDPEPPVPDPDHPTDPTM